MWWRKHRQRRYQGDKTRHLTVRIDRRTHETLCAEAKRRSISISDLVRSIIREWIDGK